MTRATARLISALSSFLSSFWDFLCRLCYTRFIFCEHCGDSIDPVFRPPSDICSRCESTMLNPSARTTSRPLERSPAPTREELRAILERGRWRRGGRQR